MVVLPDGTLVAFARRGPLGGIIAGQRNSLILKRSVDQGESWLPAGAPVVAADLELGFALTESVFLVRAGEGLFDVAVDRGTGNLYAVWQDGRFGPTPLSRIAFAMSTDGGLTWSEPVEIARTPPNASLLLGQSFLPSVHVNDRGVVGVTYYDFRNDTSDTEDLADHWFIHCDPARSDCTEPGSWEGELRLTKTSFDYLAAPRANIIFLFLGDYVGLTSDGDDFLALFPVSSADDPATILFARIEAAGIDVEIDLKPGNDTNTIHPVSRGVIPVAILGSDSFDVADVDATTLAFGPNGAPLAHRNGPHRKDANHDEIDDLLAHFWTGESGIAAGDAEACVTGEVLDGTPVEGCDSVRTVPSLLR